MSEGLRQRPGKGDEDKRREELIKAASQSAPEIARPYIAKAAPLIVTVWNGVEACIPFVLLAKAKLEELWELAQPYHPDDLMPALFGLAMVFFGGDFPLLIATMVAFKETGTWKSCGRAMLDIWDEAKSVIEESKVDDNVDADGNGVPDVQQVSAQQVLHRKLALAAKTVNPQKVTSAMVAFSSGGLAVAASLKLTFARTLSLGASLGSTLAKPAERHLTPVLKKSIDKEYHQWIKPLIAYGCKLVGMTFAFWLQRIISAVHSAIQGGQMFSTNICRYLNKYKVIAFDPDTSNLDEMAGYVFAFLGLYFQLFYGTPLVLSLVLLPLTLCEWGIKIALSWM
mmetsp:Transcript_49469/g.112282  ORF Transcript_49469/g.112282 Transcript_49469/m.112282 type:complete len:340 (+) Transcript_49469:186-1205(+)|eukprot:CAMPEP_0172651162 /NCGR_PEP_ID=MMETSP1068-20121228/242664_1 /TAXON_ID=35684 /ORGANISM="Pseudopedinella elastica, Strain CCMP716" /LENGTH=339 /DNA_ID=CAMNT_0013465547 /DNA_START=192 /DNA_END=1211 /DNA_ORIENTATION=+